jgi:hypothetical protein
LILDSLVDDDLIIQYVYHIIEWTQANVVDPTAFRVIFLFFRKGFGFQQEIQNLADFFERQVQIGDHVKQKISVMKRVDIHGLPREKFGPILAKNKIFIKIFFAPEQYVIKLIC